MMTKEDYMLLYLEGEDILSQFIFGMEEPCPIFRELILELENPSLAEDYALCFRIFTDPELVELIKKLGNCSLWQSAYNHPQRGDRSPFSEDEGYDEEEESIWEGYEGKGWKYK